ncbi:MAG: hypothetical protein BWY40_01124 [bacterium ADurb.Bin270]|nr:MAG: hypothetical protein BWY40_01124 [bacterium ADurb.Bin270]
MSLLRFLDRIAHLLGNLRGIGSPGAKHYLNIPVHVLYRVYQVDDPFLSGNPADEKNIRNIFIYSVFLERILVLLESVFIRIYAVIDDFYFFRIHIEEFYGVLLHPIRHGDYSIGLFHRAALDPAA